MDRIDQLSSRQRIRSSGPTTSLLSALPEVTCGSRPPKVADHVVVVIRQSRTTRARQSRTVQRTRLRQPGSDRRRENFPLHSRMNLLTMAVIRTGGTDAVPLFRRVASEFNPAFKAGKALSDVMRRALAMLELCRRSAASLTATGISLRGSRR